ncbi:hypothetical protein BDV98DRAFT_383979 [Pterulicium gracile]|uniref:Uncharacterized protein n=1 Tax=Pterulicium gracile TaxID=1884261 RepID=A0A5C3QT48_9AGAR|nr:hypothetical protein BDV98DRAFT_383979 [Pterula gracilis]
MASFYALLHNFLNLFTFSDAGPAPNSPSASYHAPPGTARQRSPSNATASGSRRSRSYSTSSRAAYDQSSMNEFSADYVNFLLPGMTVTMAPSVREKRRRRGEQSIRLKRWSGEHEHPHERERSAGEVATQAHDNDASRTPSPQSPLGTTQNALLNKEMGERRNRRHTVPEPSMSSS